jgi:hypothetical protein
MNAWRALGFMSCNINSAIDGSSSRNNPEIDLVGNAGTGTALRGYDLDIAI